MIHLDFSPYKDSVHPFSFLDFVLFKFSLYLNILGFSITHLDLDSWYQKDQPNLDTLHQHEACPTNLAKVGNTKPKHPTQSKPYLAMDTQPKLFL